MLQASKQYSFDAKKERNNEQKKRKKETNENDIKTESLHTFVFFSSTWRGSNIKMSFVGDLSIELSLPLSFTLSVSCLFHLFSYFLFRT